MVQGIMHFTSSLYASTMTSFNVACSTYLHDSIFDKKNGIMPCDSILIQLHLNSSDDGGAHVTQIIKNYKQNIDLLRAVKVFHAVRAGQKAITYKKFGVIYSEKKSVLCTFGPLSEFNSIFRVGNGLIVPLIKYTFQTVTVKSASQMSQRQEIYSNLTKQVLESGGSTLLASICQKCQMGIHYSGLGMNVSEAFPIYKKLLLEKPSVPTGFFILEPEQVCGLFGLNFAEWLFINKNEKGNKTLRWMYSNRLFELNETGKPTVRIELKFGNAFLKKQTIVKLNIGDMTITEIEKDIKSLYEVYPTKKVTLFKIFSKALKVPVDSFGLSTTSKFLASGLYCLTMPCISISKKGRYFRDEIPKKEDVMIDENDSIKEASEKRTQVHKQLLRDQKEKTSFIKFINDIELKEGFNDDDLEFLYPEKEHYEATLLKLKDMSISTVYKNMRIRIAFRFLQIKIPRGLKSSVSPMDVFRTFWFGLGTEGTLTAKRNLLTEIMKRYPFINPSYQSVISNKDSPFYEDEFGLFNFVSSLRSRDVKHTILGPLPVGLGFEKTIERVISLSYIHNFSYSIGSLVTSVNIQPIKEKLHSSLIYVNESPLTKEKKLMKMAEVLKSFQFENIMKENDKMSFFLKNNKTTKSLAIMQNYMKSNNLDKYKRMIDDMLEAKEGVLLVWQKQQTYSRKLKTWVGEGIARIFIDGDPFRVFIFDDAVTGVETLSLKRLTKSWKTMTRLLTDMKIDKTAKYNGKIAKGVRVGSFKKFRGQRDFRISELRNFQEFADIFENNRLIYMEKESDDVVLDLSDYSLRFMWADEGKRNQGGVALSIGLKDKKIDYDKPANDIVSEMLQKEFAEIPNSLIFCGILLNE
jgi:hypothetical protein